MTKEVGESTTNIEDLTVLDLGAGNGMVGERLRECGVKNIYGVDIEKEAKKAIDRDRPDVYEDYFVTDLMNTPDDVRRDLEEKSFDCLTTVAALGFGDIPPNVFAEGFNLISVSGWIAFNIKETFLSDNDSTGFSCLIHRMIDNGILVVHSQERYKHRLSISGEPLYYIAIIGEKIANIPEFWLEPKVQKHNTKCEKNLNPRVHNTAAVCFSNRLTSTYPQGIP